MINYMRFASRLCSPFIAWQQPFGEVWASAKRSSQTTRRDVRIVFFHKTPWLLSVTSVQ
ncbi:hypothetical protein JOD67_000149 [Tenggerimyces flavus]|nr:hypothetical protein [Tenggerimyces flavus]